MLPLLVDAKTYKSASRSQNRVRTETQRLPHLESHCGYVRVVKCDDRQRRIWKYFDQLLLHESLTTPRRYSPDAQTVPMPASKRHKLSWAQCTRPYHHHLGQSTAVKTLDAPPQIAIDNRPSAVWYCWWQLRSDEAALACLSCRPHHTCMPLLHPSRHCRAPHHCIVVCGICTYRTLVSLSAALLDCHGRLSLLGA